MDYSVALCKVKLVNANKNKGMVLGGEEGSVCEVNVEVRQLEHISEFKELGFVLDGSGQVQME